MPMHLVWLSPVLLVLAGVSWLVPLQGWGFVPALLVAEAASLGIHVHNHRRTMTWSASLVVLGDLRDSIVNIVGAAILVIALDVTVKPLALLCILFPLAICSLSVHAKRHHPTIWTSGEWVRDIGFIAAALAIALLK